MTNLSKTLVVALTLTLSSPALAISKQHYLSCYKEEILQLQRMLMTGKPRSSVDVKLLAFLSAAHSGLASHEVSLVRDAFIKSDHCQDFTGKVSGITEKRMRFNSKPQNIGHCQLGEIPMTRYLLDKGVLSENRLLGQSNYEFRNLKMKFEKHSLQCSYLDREMISLVVKTLRSNSTAKEFFEMFF